MAIGREPDSEGDGVRVIYLFDMDGWALEDIGFALRDALAPAGVEVEPVRRDRWLASPRGADVLYWGWSGMARPDPAVRRHAGRVVTTVHDPQEISHFENRADWRRFPCKPLYWFDAVDRVSVISDELRDVMARCYDREVARTPTWPSQWRSLRATQDRPERAAIKVISSTKMRATFPMREIASRWRHWSSYLVDGRGRLAPRQALGLAGRSRRKNLPLLRRISRRFAADPRLQCEFNDGGPRFAARDDYLHWLADADVYACTSNMEGGPLPVMESVLAGLAVVSTPVGQVGEWVVDGHNGFIARTEAEFVAALNRYADDRELLRQHQAASRQIAAAFTPPIDPWLRFLSDWR